MSKRVLLSCLVFILFAFALAGCSNAPAQDPTLTIQNGMKKLAKIQAFGFDLTALGDIKGPTGEKPQVVKFNLKTGGAVDVKNVQDPRLDL